LTVGIALDHYHNHHQIYMLKTIRNLLLTENFQVNERLDLGITYAELYASSKKSIYFYPYYIHCYVFKTADANPVTLQKVVAYHALATSYTERFKNKRSRWFRLKVPITISVIVSENGFEEAAIQEAVNKQNDQMGHANVTALIDASNLKFYSLEKSGFVGGLPLSYANKLIRKIANHLGHKDKHT